MGIRQEWHVDNPTHSPDFRGHVRILANKNGDQQNAGADDEAESQDYMKPRQNNMSMWRSTNQNPNQTNVISTWLKSTHIFRNIKIIHFFVKKWDKNGIRTRSD